MQPLRSNDAVLEDDKARANQPPEVRVPALLTFVLSRTFIAKHCKWIERQRYIRNSRLNVKVMSNTLRGNMHSTPLICNNQRVYSHKFSLSGRDVVRPRTHVHRAVHAVAQSRDVEAKSYGWRSATLGSPKTAQRKNPRVRRIQPFDLRKTCTR